MAEKRYYWLKLQSDFFDSKRIKKLRKIAGGDTYTIIYLKMQLVAMKKDGILEYTGLESSFAEELALELDENVENVRMTVAYLLNCGLLETADEREYFLPYAVANTGSEGSSAKRMREYREKQASPKRNEPVTLPSHCDDEASLRYGEKEIDKREREERRDIGRERPECQQIADLYNSICKSFPSLRSLSEARKKAIKARLNRYTVEDFKMLFQKAEESDFLKGANDRNWTATFDWLIKDANMAKVLDGNYDSKRKEPVPTYSPQQVNNIERMKKTLERINGS